MINLDNDMITINAGLALGGCVVGITEGALSEKKSVRDLAANFSSNKIGEFHSEFQHGNFYFYPHLHEYKQRFYFLSF